MRRSWGRGTTPSHRTPRSHHDLHRSCREPSQSRYRSPRGRSIPRHDSLRTCTSCSSSDVRAPVMNVVGAATAGELVAAADTITHLVELGCGCNTKIHTSRMHFAFAAVEAAAREDVQIRLHVRQFLRSLDGELFV